MIRDQANRNLTNRDSINIMTHKKSFRPNEENNNQALLPQNIHEQADSNAKEPRRKKLRHLLIGSPELVQSAINYYLATGQAEMGDWSPLQPYPDDPEEVVSILVRHIMVK